jgi:opacity protein-like surface antigen
MKKVLYIIFFTAIASAAMAQNSYISWQYSVGFTTGDLHNYIKPVSWRGFDFDYRKFVKPNVGVGFEVGWNVFYEKKPFDTYTNGKWDYSGKQYRYSNNVPILVSAAYYINPTEKFTPFIGLGIGTMYSQRDTEMGQYSFELDAWHFAMRPELGVIFNSQDGVGISLSTKYFYGVKTGDLPAEGFFTLNIGLLIYQY